MHPVCGTSECGGLATGQWFISNQPVGVIDLVRQVCLSPGSMSEITDLSCGHNWIRQPRGELVSETVSIQINSNSTLVGLIPQGAAYGEYFNPEHRGSE